MVGSRLPCRGMTQNRAIDLHGGRRHQCTSKSACRGMVRLTPRLGLDYLTEFRQKTTAAGLIPSPPPLSPSYFDVFFQTELLQSVTNLSQGYPQFIGRS